MTQAVNFKWAQGEDLIIDLIYKEGDDPRRAVAVPLGTGYALRMDILTSTGTLVYTVNSDGADGPVETTLSNGTDGSPNISIKVPRQLAIGPDGEVFVNLDTGKPTTAFLYDVFLRNTETDTQVKILKGNILVEKSRTQWV